MKQSAPRLAVEPQRRILCHLSGGIGNPADYGNLSAVAAAAGNGLSRLSGTEHSNVLRQLHLQAGSIERIMIAMN
ncbi:hypothetical protein D3C81_2298800 [compost metagenome]